MNLLAKLGLGPFVEAGLLFGSGSAKLGFEDLDLGLLEPLLQLRKALAIRLTRCRISLEESALDLLRLGGGW